MNCRSLPAHSRAYRIIPTLSVSKAALSRRAIKNFVRASPLPTFFGTNAHHSSNSLARILGDISFLTSFFLMGEGEGASFRDASGTIVVLAVGGCVGDAGASPVFLFFNHLALAAAVFLSRIFSWNVRSRLRRFCVHFPSQIVKKGAIIGRSFFVQRALLMASIRAIRLSSSGREQPVDRHAIIRSFRYAPCSSRVRCIVSAM